ncbi:MAG TPA: rhomboid family intramembrane serine protease [Bacteroidia bacterium]|nr:rhomboid family intramembrane serine protease [Bacteroidia bacterium]
MPPVTKNIIIINVILFFATYMLQGQGIDLNDILGLHYFQSEKFHVWQFITYMFMHGSVMHIFFNMFAVWMFGAAVENMWGPKRFLNYYILTGLGAAAAHYAIVFYQLQPAIEQLNSMLANSSLSESQLYEVAEQKTALLDGPVVIGASGAVFGILVAFGMYFPNTLLFILPIPFPIKAKYAVILYGLIELFAGVANFTGDNVAHFAHLGGLICGFIIIQFWKHNDHNQN